MTANKGQPGLTVVGGIRRKTQRISDYTTEAANQDNMSTRNVEQKEISLGFNHTSRTASAVIDVGNRPNAPFPVPT